MNIEEFDSNFSEAEFLTKVDNIFIQICNAIMMESIEDIRHFVNAEVYQELEQKLSILQQKEQRQMYDELNVKTSRIMKKEVLENSMIIEVELISRYMDYIVRKSDFQLVTGNNQSRIQKRNLLTFEKKKDAKQLNEARQCPNCGANMDLNRTGICSYCGTTFQGENYDWILTSFKILN